MSAPFRFDRIWTFPVPPAELWAVLERTDDYVSWWSWLREFETDDVLHVRALAAIEDVAGRATGPVLVISHGGLIRVVERALGSEPHSVPNLGGLDIRGAGGADGADGHRLALSGRLVLIDPAAVTVTAPPEV